MSWPDSPIRCASGGSRSRSQRRRRSGCGSGSRNPGPTRTEKRTTGGGRCATCSRRSTIPACSCRPSTPGTPGGEAEAARTGRLPAPRVPAGGARTGRRALPADRGESEGVDPGRLRDSMRRRRTNSYPDRPGCSSRPDSASSCRRGGRARGRSCASRPARSSSPQDEEQGRRSRSRRSSIFTGRSRSATRRSRWSELRGPGQAQGAAGQGARPVGRSSAPRRSRRRSTSGRPRGRTRITVRQMRADGPGRRPGPRRPGLRGCPGRWLDRRAARSTGRGKWLRDARARRGVPRGRSGPTRSGATRGSSSSAAGASAPAWPTTWAWARPSRRSP